MESFLVGRGWWVVETLQSLQDKELLAVTSTKGRWRWRAGGCCEGHLTARFVFQEGLAVLVVASL